MDEERSNSPEPPVDPLEDDPEAEFAPTVAMAAIPVAAPEAPRPATHVPASGLRRVPTGPRPPGPSRSSTEPVASTSRRYGVSAFLAALGGIGLIVAFFQPMLSGSYVTDEAMGEADFLPAEVLFGEDDVPDELAARVEVGRSALRALGFDDFFVAYHAVDSEAGRQTLIRDYGISPFQAALFLRLLDTEAALLEVDEETQVASRFLWIGLSWIVLSGVFAMFLALLRGFRPLNGLQVAWSGLFGLVWLLAAVGMLLVDERRDIGGVDLTPFQGVGIYVLLASASLLWLSAFVGLSARNWWQAPLFGLLLLIVFVGTCVGPALALTL